MSIIVKAIMTSIMSIMRIFPIQNNKVVFSNFTGKGYGDNPKYIYEALSNILEVDAVWIVSDLRFSKDIPPQVRLVKNRSLKKFYELATAKVWVDNCRKSEYILKRKKQYYIMTWHAGLCLKKVEKDAEHELGEKYVKYAMKDAKKIDLMVSNCRWCTELYKRSFWYSGRIIEVGLPRNDLFIGNAKNDNFKKKIAVYAPTFRNNMSLEAYKLDIKETLQCLSEKFGGEWVFILRLHPSLQLDNGIEDKENNIIDASDYGDIYELLRNADVLFTDYSSIIFDFALTRKPAFIFAVDTDEYSKERGTYFDLRQLPFPFADSNKILLDNINHFDSVSYRERLENFFTDIGLKETGNASVEIAKVIKRVMNK